MSETPAGNAAGYERFSTENQSSTEDQMGVNEDLADEFDLTIVRHFQDEGITRSLDDRPGLMSMFAYVEAHPHIKYIVVNELERLTAGVGQRAAVTRMCKRLGITIVTEDMGMIDPHDDDKMYEADQRALLAQGEVLKIRRRTRRSLKQKARRGVVIMRPPYGTRMGVDGIEVHDEEIVWLRRIFEWAADGVALGTIRRKLDEAGVPTKAGKTHWSTTAIRGILDNPFYKGEMSWGRKRTLRDENGRKYAQRREDGDPEVIINESPLGALVPVALWDKVQEVKVERAGLRERRPNQVRLLDNMLFCARCGYKMYCHDNGRRDKPSQLQYSCYTPSRPARKPLPDFGGFLCSTPHSISIRYVVEALAGVQMEGGLSIDATVTVGGGGSIVRQRKRHESEIAKAKAKKNNAQDLAIEGDISKEKLRAVKAEADATIAKAQAALADLEARGGVGVEPYAGIFNERLLEVAERVADETRPIEMRRALLANAGLDRIYLDKPVMRLHFRE